MATAVPPDPQRHDTPSVHGVIVPLDLYERMVRGGGSPPHFTSLAWLGPLFQGLTLVTIIGAVFWFGNQTEKLSSVVEKATSIERALNDPSTGVTVRLARIEEQLEALAPAPRGR